MTERKRYVVEVEKSRPADSIIPNWIPVDIHNPESVLEHPYIHWIWLRRAPEPGELLVVERDRPLSEVYPGKGRGQYTWREVTD